MSDRDKNISISITTGTIFRFFLIVILLLGIYYLRDIFLVILTSIVIASFVHIVADRMVKYRFNHTLSVVLVYIASIAIFSSLFYFFIPILLHEVINFFILISDYLPQSNLVDNLQNGTLGGARDIISSISSNSSAAPSVLDSIKSFIEGLSGGFLSTIGLAFGGVLNMILIIIISFYLSIQEKGIENFLRIIIPLKYEDYAVDLWNRSKRKIALWVRGQLFLGLIIGALVYIGLSIFGVRYALLLGLVSAIFELIPFGLYFSAIPAIIFSYLDGGLALLLMTTGFFMLVHILEQYFIQPIVVKKSIGISPLVVILSVLVGFKLVGFWGIILAVPVAVSLLEFTGDIEKKKILAKS